MTKISVSLGDIGGGSPTAHGWSVLSRYLLPLLLALTWSQLTDTEKTFSSAKRTVTGRDETKGKDKKPRPKKKRPAPISSEDDSSMSSLASDVDGDTPGPSRPKRRKTVTKKRKTTKTFSTSVSLARMVEASLHLTHAARLGHAYILVEAQLVKLDGHLSDFVKILGTDLHHKWLTYNYHIVSHIVDQIRLHGPPRSYWAYPSERLYGLMKQVKTNRHRDGGVEFSLLSRTDDRHRVATVVNSLPPAPLAIVLKKIIDGQHNQGGKGMADEDPDSSSATRPSKYITLNPTQLEAVCAIANQKRPAGYEPLIPFTSSTTNSARENVATRSATRLDRILVKNTTLAPKSTSPSPSSDPSMCIVQLGSNRRAARYQYGFNHTFFEESASKMVTLTYAEVHLLDTVEWPRQSLFRNSMWGNLGYIFATKDSSETIIVSLDDIVCAALTVDTSSITWTEEGTLVAIPT